MSTAWLSKMTSKQCRYWSKEQGCHHQASCLYLHVKSPIQQHQELIVINEVRINDNLVSSCDKCELKFAFEIDLQNHKELYHKYIVHSCDICDQQFESEYTMNRHVLTHHKEKHHTCEQSGKCLKPLEA